MSGAEFGSRIGLPQTKIADLEREKTKISIEVMNALELEFDVSQQWLIDGVGDWQKSAAIKKFEGRKDSLQYATKMACLLGLNSDDANRVQEIIFGLKVADKLMVERALNAMRPDEALLLKNYRACSKQGKEALKLTSMALAQSAPSFSS